MKPHLKKSLFNFESLNTLAPKDALESVEIALEQIQLTPRQQAQLVPASEIASLGESIASLGLKIPVMVRQLATGYELVYGYRRVLAHQKLGRVKIAAIVTQLSAEEALEVSLLENLQRQELSPLDETIWVLEFLALKTQLATEEVIAEIYRCKKRGLCTQNQQNSLLSYYQQVSRRSIATFASDYLPCLKMSPELLDAVRQGLLPYTVALNLSRIKDPQLAQEIQQLAISGDRFTYEVVRKLVTLSKKFPQRALNLSRLLSRGQIERAGLLALAKAREEACGEAIAAAVESGETMSLEQILALAAQPSIVADFSQTLKLLQASSSLWSDQQKTAKLSHLLAELQSLVDS